MGDAFWIVLATTALAVLIVPAALLALLARQVFRHRPYTTMGLVVLGFAVFPVAPIAWGAAVWLQLDGRRRVGRAAAADHVTASLGRTWSKPVRAAQMALRRYDESVLAMRPGPLRERLTDLRREMLDGIADVERLCADGARLDGACRDVERALSQRRRSARGADGPALQSALVTQGQTLERLQARRLHVRGRVQTLVAHLEQIAAHATELSVEAHDETYDALAAPAASEQMQALRSAVADLDRLAGALPAR